MKNFAWIQWTCLAVLVATLLLPTDVFAATDYFGSGALDELTDKLSDVIFSKGLRFVGVAGIGVGIVTAVFTSQPGVMWTAFLIGGVATIAPKIINTMFVTTMLIP
jgi:hypothetical protein